MYQRFERGPFPLSLWHDPITLSQDSPTLHQVKHLALLLLSLLPLASGFAETYSRHSVRTMCHLADAIVIGSVVEGDTVRVERWIRPGVFGESRPDMITIDNLSNLLRQPGRLLGDMSLRNKVLPLSRFVAFLRRSDKNWECLSTRADSSTTPGCGSSGLIWILDGKCHAYAQAVSPGPYQLFAIEDLAKWGVVNPYADWIEPVSTEARLLSEIDAGIEDAKAWDAVLDEPDPVRKASQLAAYYLPGTSPVGKRKTFLYEIEDHIDQLGGHAVPALVKALQSRQPGDDLTALFWTLRRFPANTEAAIPELSKLLGDPLSEPSPYLIGSLAHTESPQILPALWPFLLSPFPHVREAAEEAINRITPDHPSPAKLAKTSTHIAIVRTFPPPPSAPVSTSRPIVRARVQQNLKGQLPEKLILIEVPDDPAYGELLSLKNFGSALVFLRQDEQGKYLLTNPQSLTSYGAAGADWPREHFIPLEKIQAAISATSQDLSPAGS